MKILITKRAQESGSAVIVMILLVGIILMYTAFNLKTLAYLKQELRIVERKQVQRLSNPRGMPEKLPSPSAASSNATQQ